MRLYSEYHFECASCGREVVSREKEGVCACGFAFRIKWPAEYEHPKKDS